MLEQAGRRDEHLGPALMLLELRRQQRYTQERLRQLSAHLRQQGTLFSRLALEICRAVGRAHRDGIA